MSIYTLVSEVNFEKTSPCGAILNKPDYVFNEDLYTVANENGYPIVYRLIYEYYKNMKDDRKPILFSMDGSVSSATIAGLNEKNMYIVDHEGRPNYKSKLKVLYLDSRPDITLHEPKKEHSISDTMSSVISNLISVDKSYTQHKLNLSSDQLLYIGLNDNITNPDEIKSVSLNRFKYHMLNKTRKSGWEYLYSEIDKFVLDDPVHLVLDMSVLDHTIGPCVIKHNPNKKDVSELDGLNGEEFINLMKHISKLNVKSMDITGFYFATDNTTQAYRITCETAKLAYQIIFNLKDKKLNIFNENTRFLIWKDLQTLDIDKKIELYEKGEKEKEIDIDGMTQEEIDKLELIDDEIGWYIMRDVSLEMRERFIADLKDSDSIKTISIVDDDGKVKDVMITSTTIEEQNSKSYFTAKLYLDCVLYPEEKMAMMFELLNTSENKILEDK